MSEDLLCLASENGFELIYCEQGSAYNPSPLNIRAGYLEHIYPNSSLVPQSRPHRQAGIHTMLERAGSVKSIQAQGTMRKTFVGTTTQLNFTASPTKANQSKIQAGEDNADSNGNSSTMNNTQGASQANKIDNIYKVVKGMLDGNSIPNLEQFSAPIAVILSQLANWELLSDKDVKTACKGLKLVAESRVNSVLALPANVTQMINLLYSQDTPIDVQITTVWLFLIFLVFLKLIR